MEVYPDFKELLRLFNENRVEYIIVGAYALAFHGSPRYTGDLDILIKPEKDNAVKILSALEEFGFGSLELDVKDFSRPDKVIQLGVPPVRVDIITSITGVSSEEAFAGKISGEFGDIQVDYMGLEQLIANKRAMGRKKDLADLESLGKS
jgi:predicted nucleotidyltransferase